MNLPARVREYVFPADRRWHAVRCGTTAGRPLNKASCDVEHVGIVISGRATAAMDGGRVSEMPAGDLFYVAPGHESWVVGDEPYVSLHLLGASDYAAAKSPGRSD